MQENVVEVYTLLRSAFLSIKIMLSILEIASIKNKQRDTSTIKLYSFAATTTILLTKILHGLTENLLSHYLMWKT